MDTKKIRWFTVAFIAFNMVWGMGNVVNNFAQQGITVVTSWLLILALYFIPYALIVGQLGSTFKDSKGGSVHGSKIPVRNAWLIMLHGLIG